MSQPSYIVSTGIRGRAPEQAHDIKVYFEQERKTIGTSGLFTRTAGTGRKTGRLVLRFLRAPNNGFHNFSRAVTPTAAEIKGVVRRLRTEDALSLDTVDAQIENLRQQIAALHSTRVQILKQAWARGNVVRLNEITARAEGLY